MEINNFGAVLRHYRESAGRSRNNLAHKVGVDPSYLTRIEHGDREPPRKHIVEAIGRELRLSVYDYNRLLVAAGCAPRIVGDWSSALQAVADVLTDVRLTRQDKESFNLVVREISLRWLASGTTQPSTRIIPTEVPQEASTTQPETHPLERE